ncbi:MAG TPA: hypothetical protein VLK65_32690 [Vicinamibacteria bacterium]|nr:hypothetical protein [Vicinamibacteria bacterium]
MSKSYQRLERFALPTVVVALVGLLGGAGSVLADLDNDGLDDLFVFSVEIDGLERGPWYQVWKSNNTLLTGAFILNGFTDFQFFAADVVAGGGDEQVVGAYRLSDGSYALQARNAAGAVVASSFLTGPGFTRHQIFPVELAAFAGTEVGVGFVRDTDQVAFYQVWRRSGASFVLIQGVAILGPGFTNHFFGAGDFDADGTDEIFLGADRRTDGAALFKIYSAAAGTVMQARYVTGPGFRDHRWVLANFWPDTTNPGTELVHGFRRRSDGAGAFQVWDELDTTPLTSQFIDGGGFSEHDWRPLDTASDANQELFVGFRRDSDHTHAFKVYAPNVSPVPVTSVFVTGPDLSLTDWAVGDFDGNSANGQEVAAVFQRESDANVGYVVRFNTGAVHSSRFVLGTGFIGPRVKPVRAFVATRDDLQILAQSQAGNAPALQVWQAGAATPGFSRFVLNSDILPRP